jgi:hypothetical protein
MSGNLVKLAQRFVRLSGELRASEHLRRQVARSRTRGVQMATGDYRGLQSVGSVGSESIAAPSRNCCNFVTANSNCRLVVTGRH